MTPADREFALKGLDDSRERLLRMLSGLSREQLAFRPAPDRWSVAENLEHVIVAEKFVVGRLEGSPQQAADSPNHSRWEGRDEPLVRKLAEERGDRFQAPEPFRPIGRWPTETLVGAFEAARARSREFAASTQADLRNRFFRHPAPAVGEIDGYQLLLLIGAPSFPPG
jgi:DinB superfamily